VLHLRTSAATGWAIALICTAAIGAAGAAVVAARVAAAPRVPSSPAARTGSRTTITVLRYDVGRIPGYRSRKPARWVISNRYPGTWGVTDWYHDTIYISPSVPTGYLPSVVRHEWSHELSVRAYGGDVAAAVRAMNRVFGGGGSTGIRGAEYAADCMAVEIGATWTHYTTCDRPSCSASARSNAVVTMGGQGSPCGAVARSQGTWADPIGGGDCAAARDSGLRGRRLR
jgi:hypothetical protein